jgi:hypothetical protein
LVHSMCWGISRTLVQEPWGLRGQSDLDRIVLHLGLYHDLRGLRDRVVWESLSSSSSSTSMAVIGPVSSSMSLLIDGDGDRSRL